MPPPPASWFGIEETDVVTGKSTAELTSLLVRACFRDVICGCAGLEWGSMCDRERTLSISLTVQALQETGRGEKACEFMELINEGVCGLAPDTLLLYLQLLCDNASHKKASELASAHLTVNSTAPTTTTLSVLALYCKHILPKVQSAAAAQTYLEACYLCYYTVGSEMVDKLRAEVKRNADAEANPPKKVRTKAERTIVAKPAVVKEEIPEEVPVEERRNVETKVYTSAPTEVARTPWQEVVQFLRGVCVVYMTYFQGIQIKKNHLTGQSCAMGCQSRSCVVAVLAAEETDCAAAGHHPLMEGVSILHFFVSASFVANSDNDPSPFPTLFLPFPLPLHPADTNGAMEYSISK